MSLGPVAGTPRLIAWLSLSGTVSKTMRPLWGLGLFAPIWPCNLLSFKTILLQSLWSYALRITLRHLTHTAQPFFPFLLCYHCRLYSGAIGPLSFHIPFLHCVTTHQVPRSAKPYPIVGRTFKLAFARCSTA